MGRAKQRHDQKRRKSRLRESERAERHPRLAGSFSEITPIINTTTQQVGD